MQRRRFLQPESGREMMAELDRTAHPVRSFVDEKCVVAPDRKIKVDDLYGAFREWCNGNGHRIAAKNTFGKDLLAGYRKVKWRKIWKNDLQKHVAWYEGIDLDRAAPPEEYEKMF
jgi:putative DNA primase/helicase